MTIAMLVNLSALVPGKLRDVEVMCQENEGVEGGDLIRKVSEIILLNNYANNVQFSFHFQKVNFCFLDERFNNILIYPIISILLNNTVALSSSPFVFWIKFGNKI